MAAFKKIPGYSLYEISEKGEIRKIVSKELISQRIHPMYGYKMCDLLDDNLKVHTVYPHKEVARTYMPLNKDGRMYVIHINGNPEDNNLKNLKWATPPEAQLHQVKMGLRKRIGNPQLYKFSKFWLAKQNKKSKDKGVAMDSKKLTVKSKGGKGTAKVKNAPKTKVAKKSVAIKSNSLKSKAAPKINNSTKKVTKAATGKIKSANASSKNILAAKGAKKKVAAKPAAKAKKVVVAKKAVAKKKAPAKVTKVAAKKKAQVIAVKSNTKKATPAKKAEIKKKPVLKEKTKSSKNIKKASTKSKKMGESTTLKRVPSKLLSNNEAKVERKEKRQRIKYKKIVSSAGKKSS